MVRQHPTSLALPELMAGWRLIQTVSTQLDQAFPANAIFLHISVNIWWGLLFSYIDYHQQFRWSVICSVLFQWDLWAQLYADQARLFQVSLSGLGRFALGWAGRLPNSKGKQAVWDWEHPCLATKPVVMVVMLGELNRGALTYLAFSLWTGQLHYKVQFLSPTAFWMKIKRKKENKRKSTHMERMSWV